MRATGCWNGTCSCHGNIASSARHGKPKCGLGEETLHYSTSATVGRAAGMKDVVCSICLLLTQTARRAFRFQTKLLTARCYFVEPVYRAVSLAQRALNWTINVLFERIRRKFDFMNFIMKTTFGYALLDCLKKHYFSDKRMFEVMRWRWETVLLYCSFTLIYSPKSLQNAIPSILFTV